MGVATSQEVPRAGLSPGVGTGFGAAWLRASREAGPSTWDLQTRDGQGKAAAAPKGSKGRSSAMRRPRGSAARVSAAPGPPFRALC